MYRIVLEQNAAKSVTHLFSKDLADQAGSNPAQVRRDLMTVGYNGNPQKGYAVAELIEKIRQLLEPAEGISIALIGIGNLGRAILGYFSSLHQKFKLIAAFDSDEHKVNRVIAGCKCFHVNEIKIVLQPFRIQLGVITVPGDHAQDAADLFINAGVQGIVNFTPRSIKAPGTIYVENIDITQTFEKVAYFARFQNRGGHNG